MTPASVLCFDISTFGRGWEQARRWGCWYLRRACSCRNSLVLRDQICHSTNYGTQSIHSVIRPRIKVFHCIFRPRYIPNSRYRPRNHSRPSCWEPSLALYSIWSRHMCILSLAGCRLNQDRLSWQPPSVQRWKGRSLASSHSEWCHTLSGGRVPQQSIWLSSWSSSYHWFLAS